MTIQAIYRNGVFQPVGPLDLPEETSVTVEIPNRETPEASLADLAHLAGSWKEMPVDPLVFQRQIREEWP